MTKASPPISPHAASRSASERSAAALARREKKLERDLDLERLPRHIAVIPDGNGRWAKQRGWNDRIRGHESGIQAIRMVVTECARLHIGALSVYSFSRDNWNRSRHETSALMRFFRKFLIAERPTLLDNNIRLIHTGWREDLPGYVLRALDRTLELTAGNTGMVLNLAVSYSSRQEIADAARAIAQKVAAGALTPDEITPQVLGQHLYAPEIGDPDLLIRTSGEHRISDFMLYQMSYTEIFFSSVLWPDFHHADLLEALVSYQGRQRRYGKVGGA
jgi:undecaprenyl diphosphate synthase